MRSPLISVTRRCFSYLTSLFNKWKCDVSVSLMWRHYVIRVWRLCCTYRTLFIMKVWRHCFMKCDVIILFMWRYDFMNVWRLCFRRYVASERLQATEVRRLHCRVVTSLRDQLIRRHRCLSQLSQWRLKQRHNNNNNSSNNRFCQNTDTAMTCLEGRNV